MPQAPRPRIPRPSARVRAPSIAACFRLAVACAPAFAPMSARAQISPADSPAAEPTPGTPAAERTPGTPWALPGLRLAPYGEIRGRLGRTQLNEVLDTAAAPQLGTDLEAGLSGAWTSEGSDARLDVDVAVFARVSASYRVRDASGKEVEVVPPTRERRNVNLALHEFAVRTPGGTVAFALGKRRLRLGPGYISNPANPLAPERPLLDPRDEGAGRWMASFERLAPQGRLGFHLAPGVSDDERGAPDALVRYRGEPWDAPRAHFLLLAEATLLVDDTEIGASGVLSHRYDDAIPAQPAFGLTARREIDNGLAFHAETLVRQGSGRLEARPECAESENALARCLSAGVSPLERPHADSRAWHARFVLGGRRAFDPGAFVALEWLHDSAGESVDEFARLITLGGRMRLLERAGDASSRSVAFDAARVKLRTALGDGTFTPRAKNHIAASIEDVPLWVRVTASANTVLSLRDNSGVIGPRLGWAPSGELDAQLIGAFPYSLGGGVRGGARDPAGGRVTEADASVYRYIVEARLRRTF